jgi:YD repeat-containing protein
MPHRALTPLLAALALAGLAAPSAFAADAGVAIPSRAASFTPATVTVGPNDTVTWTWTGPANERNHSPASDLRGAPESWDADPAVTPFSAKPDFDHGAGHTFAKTFVNAKAASYVYHCRVHSDMVGTVIVSGAPVPSFTATPSAAFAGDEVSFDALATTDPDGTIAKYEWDLDGNGTFETDTATTASASKTYAAPATLTTRLRVTDDHGNVRETTRPLSIVTRAPSASFTATPGTVAKNATVGLDATASAATTGRTITAYAWDLDGNGSFETDTGTTPTASASFAAAGTKTIGLQVTDSAADVTTTTRTVTVTNVLPTATFIVSNASPAIGQTVNFDATGSADSDGAVTSFQWDLDGNGTFETNTGTTPTTSKAYTSGGAVSVKLRVTDNEGGTTDLAKTVTVPSPPSSTPPPPTSSTPPPQQSAPAPAITAPIAAVTPIARPAVVPSVTPKPAVKPKPKPKAKKKAKKKKRKKKAKKKKKRK